MGTKNPWKFILSLGFVMVFFFIHGAMSHSAQDETRGNFQEILWLSENKPPEPPPAQNQLASPEITPRCQQAQVSANGVVLNMSGCPQRYLAYPERPLKSGLIIRSKAAGDFSGPEEEYEWELGPHNFINSKKCEARFCHQNGCVDVLANEDHLCQALFQSASQSIPINVRAIDSTNIDINGNITLGLARVKFIESD